MGRGWGEKGRGPSEGESKREERKEEKGWEGGEGAQAHSSHSPYSLSPTSLG